MTGRVRYYPYGGIRTQEGTLPTDKLFTGEQRETASGIYHYNARLHNADIGRFPQADTVIPEPENPAAYNRYSYVYNNPVNYTDPTGAMDCVAAGVILRIPPNWYLGAYTACPRPARDRLKIRVMIWKGTETTSIHDVANWVVEARRSSWLYTHRRFSSLSRGWYVLWSIHTVYDPPDWTAVYPRVRIFYAP